MKKNFARKLKAFSIAYAIVALIVTGIAIVGLTPVLTRKISNLSTSMTIKNVRGWYESYNALPAGEEYCSSCKKEDEDIEKKGKSKVWSKPYTYSKVTKEQEGDPTLNPYARYPHKLVPFERYCRSNGSCGYPTEKWDENEKNSPNKPNPNRPHRCKDKRCHFKPTSGITKFELYAVGGGGGSGSAVNSNPTSVPGGYYDSIKGKSNSNPLGSGNETVDNDLKINASFIDTFRTEDNGNFTSKNKNASGNFYTVGSTENNENVDNIEDLDSTGHNKFQGNFHIYPTRAWSKNIAEPSAKQVTGILKANGKAPKDNIVNRFYLYTKIVGTSSYNQNPDYTLMPEWLNINGDEIKYPCLTEIDPECKEDNTTTITDPETPIKDKYKYAVAIACSGNGGGGADVTYSKLVVCDWMKPSGCTRKAIHSTPFEETKSATGCSDVINNETGEKTGLTGCSCPAGTYCSLLSGGGSSDNCKYETYWHDRYCTYLPYSGPFVNCTCKPKYFENRCDAVMDNSDVESECYPNTVEVDFNLPAFAKESGEVGVIPTASTIGVTTEDGNLKVTFKMGKGGGKPNCTAHRALSLSASGGNGGDGICAYRREIIKIHEQYQISQVSTSNEPKKDLHNNCDNAIDGKDADNAKACINELCKIATGGKGGGGGKVKCDICDIKNASTNGANGASGSVSGEGNGGSFPKSKISTTDTTLGLGDGIHQKAGKYNWHYIWYMPYITKHLMFGEAGNAGEEIHNTLNLSEGTILEITPGLGAAKTEYKSGKNGLKGGDTTVKNEEANINYVAQGGNGGIGNKKTDEYLLCHIADKQSKDKNKPCYFKDENDNDFKKTHWYEVDNGKLVFKGIQAIKPNEPSSLNTFTMSKELKASNPGMGSMGYGTESVSDFICETRHLDKEDDAPEKNVIKQGGKEEKDCRGNNKIKYILPDQSKYTSGTGIVIIAW